MHSFLLSGGSAHQQLEKMVGLLSQSFSFQLQTSDFQPQPSSPDILVIKPSLTNSIGIDQVREITAFCSLKPYKADYKVILVQDAHTLTRESQNALLKTLEEPPARSLIFLTAPSIELLLATVVSRCQVIQTAQLPQDPGEEDELSKVLNALIRKPLAAAIRTAAEKTPDRQEAIDFCASLVSLLHSWLRTATAPPGLSFTQAAQLIRELQRTKAYLEANTSVRAAIDNLVLTMHKITQAA